MVMAFLYPWGIIDFCGSNPIIVTVLSNIMSSTVDPLDTDVIIELETGKQSCW
jgi:hypothetical protein